MSTLFNNLKMKYKLMLICSIPFIVLAYFIGNVIWHDYHALKEIRKDLQYVEIFDKTGKFLKLLGETETLGVLMIKEVQGFDRSALMIARNKTDEIFKKLVDQVQNNDLTLESGILLKDLFKGSFEKAHQLSEFRKQIDNNSIDAHELEIFYQDIRNKFFQNLDDISRSINDLNFGRMMFGYIALLHESLASDVSRRVMFEAISKGDYTETNFQNIYKSLGQEQAYTTSYLELADPEQEEFYYKTMQFQGAAELEKMQQQFMLNAGKEEKINLNPTRFWELQDKKMEKLQAIQDNITQNSVTYLESIHQSKLWELYTIIISIIVSLVISAFLVTMSLKSIVKRLQEEIVILSSSGNEIKSSITEASAGTSETAASVTETTTTVEELKQTAQVAAEKAKKVAEVSNDAINILNTGEKNLEKTIEGMMHIQNGMSTISESIIKLSEHSQSIGKIIDTVNELAEQSHLLAVNAAIEAAKAGEQGKGFSVVAQEVRSLAEQSKQATIQVRNILNDIQNATSAAVMATEQGTKAVNNGVEMSNQIGVSIQSLSEGINKVSEASSQIALSSEQQLIGVSQVNVAMTNIREATEKHVEHMHLIENAIEGMNAVGLSLKDLVTKF